LLNGRKAKDNHDVTFLVGFETEVIFLERETFPPKPISVHSWSTSAAFRTSSLGKSIVEEIHDTLVSSGISVEQFHAESAPGQYEIITGPMEPVEAVDAVVFTRETVYNVAAKYGVRATLYPKVFANACSPMDWRWLI
jgi:glutamine synthetase